MSLRVEAYMVGGVLRGVVARPGHLRDVLDGAGSISVELAVWAPIDGTPAQPVGRVDASLDDLVLAVADEEIPGPVHAAWHPIRLEAGPYVINGDLATMPGFDPGRAITRPSGQYVLLSDVRVALVDRPAAGDVSHAQALVNRYAVDAVEADLMLGFFFPGARMVDPAVGPANDHPAAGAAPAGKVATAAPATAAPARAAGTPPGAPA